MNEAENICIHEDTGTESPVCGHTHKDTHTGPSAHAYTHTEAHAHTHVHTETKNVLNRLSRAIGHLLRVKNMVEDGADCTDVLIQLAAVKAAINNCGKIILKDHIEHCLVDAIEEGDPTPVEELKKAIDQFIK